ncbi:M10 family metallopeptidase C-terminal domain-containing protein [Sphingomonas sp.]|jgi:hypothetical protein|uniref:M10 family metallopeptidase C-terminal domain-containing protein n=1 Tax=Sphingomonas sp. TaxID=28214 RepID=UPI0035C7AADC
MARKFNDAHSGFSEDLFFGSDAPALPYLDSIGEPSVQARKLRAPTSPSLDDQVAFLSGIDADGKLTDQSYWGENGGTAFKWGRPVIGTGAKISYFFDPTSNFSDVEKATFLKAFGMWSAVADVTFVEAKGQKGAGVLLRRGDDGGAYCSTPTSDGSGATMCPCGCGALSYEARDADRQAAAAAQFDGIEGPHDPSAAPGRVIGQALISIDTSVPGFDLSGSLDTYGGYGMSTIIHEVGHLLGLGHGGNYNGDVNPRTQQFSAYDDRMYTIMSYVNWTNTNAKFYDQNFFEGTDWGITDEFTYRTAPHTVMGLDILAIQQMYGVAETSPFSGGQVYGFNSNIKGPLSDFYDFAVNSSPVVTIYNTGSNNTMDLSRYTDYQYIDLRGASYSSVLGLTNNMFIHWDTDITTAIGGSGTDFMLANDKKGIFFGGNGDDEIWGGKGADELSGDAGDDYLWGKNGRDELVGGDGADRFVYQSVKESVAKIARADRILDFNRADGDKIDLSDIDAVRGGRDNDFRFLGKDSFSKTAGELIYKVANGDAQVMGDINGDGKADFTIVVEDARFLNANDFLL